MNRKLLGLAIINGLIAIAKKALSDNDGNRCKESEDYDEDVITPYKSNKKELYHVRNNSKKEQLYHVLIKGSIQCNGPKIIYKTFVADKLQAQMFTGSRKYEAIEGWIRANYPAAEPQTNYRNFSVEVKAIK